ncbi:LysR family transcriptional regulator [Microbacterium hominis]|uniref:LysR family transcriptional regulator n=1 Tax=Microbacterium hominis TaxID=162426 RepID=A0A7D4TI45_9MICO|nr:LysR family transcriptional regulator [Microbacterium hominis]QKJ20541.1 LysR family transcriptional regulator [Microbacterium hominis]
MGADHDLNLLVPLRALLEEANVTRAAQRVQMGQSSMSSALARLRAVFHDELLVRVGREYALTPLARVLLPQVQAAVPRIERVLAGDARFDPSEHHRRFSIMMTDYGAMRLHEAIAAAVAEAPGFAVDVIPLPERPIESERDLFTHDFVVTVPEVGIEGRSAPLLADEYVCLLDPANPAIADGELTFEDFARLPSAVADFGRIHFTPADRRLRELPGERAAPRVTSAAFLSLPSVVAGTDLVAVVPRVLAERLGPPTRTVFVAAPFEPAGIELLLWWHESRDSDPAHVWFRERLLETFAESVEADDGDVC